MGLGEQGNEGVYFRGTREQKSKNEGNGNKGNFAEQV